jgi:REP element-mobilizing transposase RayT
MHIFIGMKPDQSVSDLLKNIKESSSRWINKQDVIRGTFRWQAGFAAFSYAYSQINTVVKYIENQEEHHKKKTFRQEYLEFLKKYDVLYDERYIFKEIV